MFMYVAPVPTPAGCHPMTPPPGSFGGVECNLDQQFQVVGTVMSGLYEFVLVPIAVILVVAGLFAVVTGRGPVPVAITRRLPREPVSPADRRLQGLSLVITGAAVLTAGWTAARLPMAPPRDLWILAGFSAFLVFLVVGMVLNLTVRVRDRRTAEVLTGWQRIAKAFRG